ncbi:type II toxin-antitoxin system VapC family toxin [Nitrosomonas communis]|uniref:type II toxin-antitoxin system VapC family toxin n=1 Tax=Nitrosomonas communis TaxID=44574 RepID=UPI0026ECF9EB|nr:type II toxin-antitoxin system VapC family toxin [Nitrosomonas communis]MCO6428557.1 type II toxin-antitoxin system VapC family toxin [Nitrosomonas communis]
MKNKAYDLSSYSFGSDEQILVDTNVWLYLFPAPTDPSNRFANQYSTAFSNLVSAQAQPVLDPMVLSEYLNRYIRIEWKGNYKSRYPEFKDFRNSSDFSAIASAAETFAKRILSFSQIHSIPANELDLNQALADFSTGGVDFNDALLVDICKQRNLKLMTNDGDFQDGGIEVLTTNPKLLRACP